MTYLRMAYSCIIQNGFLREDKSMAAVESTGTSSEIKGQYEKQEKFVGGISFSLRKKEDGRKCE